MEFYPGFEQTPKRKYNKRKENIMMTSDEQLGIWQLVNQAETPQNLAFVINKLADSEGMIQGRTIQGRTRKFNAAKMIIGLNMFMKDEMPATVLTREYGIRQQAIFLKAINN